MEKEILEMIKKEVSDMEKIAVRDYSEIEKLEKDPNVQRYIYLKGLKENRDLIEYGARGIIYDIIEKYGHGLIKESNNIWCFLFESEVKDVKGIPISYLNDFDDDEIVVVYRDLEDSTRMIVISKEKQKEFEATHNVTYGKPSILDYSDRYNNVRHQFFEDCINYGQDVAFKKLIKKDNESVEEDQSTVILTDGINKLSMMLADNGDLYMSITNGEKLNNKSYDYRCFNINKEDEKVYNAFQELYNGILATNTSKNDVLDEDNNIVWVSDDGIKELEDNVIISEYPDYYCLMFVRNNDHLDQMDYPRKNSRSIVIRFSNSGSRNPEYVPFFMKLYNELKKDKNIQNKKQKFEVLTVPCSRPFVVSPEKAEDFMKRSNSKEDNDFVSNIAEEFRINNLIDDQPAVKKLTKKDN